MLERFRVLKSKSFSSKYSTLRLADGRFRVPESEIFLGNIAF